MRVDGRLVGRRAVVTGGASGIGLAVARRFMEEGAQVAIAENNDRALAEASRDLNRALVQRGTFGRMRGPLSEVLNDEADCP